MHETVEKSEILIFFPDHLLVMLRELVISTLVLNGDMEAIDFSNSIFLKHIKGQETLSSDLCKPVSICVNAPKGDQGFLMSPACFGISGLSFDSIFLSCCSIHLLLVSLLAYSPVYFTEISTKKCFGFSYLIFRLLLPHSPVYFPEIS